LGEGDVEILGATTSPVWASGVGRAPAGDWDPAEVQAIGE
jgi:hypothetical protein